MSTLWLFEDQLCLDAVRNARADRVLIVESKRHFAAWPFHKIRIAFQCAAIRHFAGELRQRKIDVRLFSLDRKPYLDAIRALQTVVRETDDRDIIILASSEHHCQVWVQDVCRQNKLNLKILANPLFLTDRDEFADWAKPLKSPVMETFYRKMRKKLNVLMTPDGTPEGGEWNLDKENRKPPGKGMTFPEPLTFEPDALTRGAVADVDRVFANHPGSLDGFRLAVTREQAQSALDDFVRNRLPTFGDFEDAMLTGEPTLFHSGLSHLINVGLLKPLDVVNRVEQAFRAGRVPLNSAEGFIRQIIGWREYVYGIYHTFMPEYRKRNARGVERPLPEWFWNADTKMNCLRQSIGGVIERAYSHHIQRLMVICNFATLADVSPQAVNDWFYAMYVDSFDWVVTPNVVGMGMNADGGTMATKPYVSSAAYVNRMSDYCKACSFDHSARTGDDACPFNFLFWTFLDRHRKSFGRNPRMTMMLKNLDRIAPDELRAMHHLRERFVPLTRSGVRI
jgi:deoxyribodipyrimidine photolyase-related protein